MSSATHVASGAPSSPHGELVEPGGRATATTPATWLRTRTTTLLHALVAFWIFCGGMVITEPSPYELAFLLVLGTSLFAGFHFQRSTNGLLVLFLAFVPFALIGAFQVQYNSVPDSIIYQAVTIFLFFTAYWVANYIAEDPEPRLRLVLQAYLVTALISAVLGTLGYLGIGHALFTRFDRAKAFFNDPNVYGPFLILPAMWVLQRVFLGERRHMLWNIAAYGILFVGVFMSFSRAAWGHVVISSIIVFALVFLLEAKARQQARMLMLALAAVAALVVAAAGALSIPSLTAFIELRTQSQNYDTGESGRFGRQGYAYDLALQHPLGLGPLEFRNLRVPEEPHNTYVNVLHAYGWGGGLAFILFIGVTVWRGVSFLARPSPSRKLLIPLVAVFVPLAGEAAIIDIDHWRHFFLVGGLIWGVTATWLPRASRLNG